MESLTRKANDKIYLTYEKVVEMRSRDIFRWFSHFPPSTFFFFGFSKFNVNSSFDDNPKKGKNEGGDGGGGRMRIRKRRQNIFLIFEFRLFKVRAKNMWSLDCFVCFIEKINKNLPPQINLTTLNMNVYLNLIAKKKK